MSDTIRDEGAERAVLGLLVQRPALIDRVRQLQTDMFVNPAHQAIFDAVRAAADLRGVQPDHHVVLERLIAAGAVDRSRGAPYLVELIGAAPTAANLGFHAALIVSAAHRRLALLIASQLTTAAKGGDDDGFRANMAELSVRLGDIADRTPHDQAPRPDGLSRLGEFVDQADPLNEWIVPDLISRQDRVMIVAEEGIGKSTLARQMATCVASGIHPFNPNGRIPAQRTLIVDLENPPPLIRRKARPVVAAARAFGAWEEDNVWLWARPGGINLRRPADVNMLDGVVEEVRPALICFGPLYKAFMDAGDRSEQAAGEVAEALDRIRGKHRCALWLEHHAPMRQAGHRDLRPFGSGVWARWVEFGLTLQLERPEDTTQVILGRFKYDRDERDWPDKLKHGQQFPWVGWWQDGIPASAERAA